MEFHMKYVALMRQKMNGMKVHIVKANKNLRKPLNLQMNF